MGYKSNRRKWQVNAELKLSSPHPLWSYFSKSAEKWKDYPYVSSRWSCSIATRNFNFFFLCKLGNNILSIEIIIFFYFRSIIIVSNSFLCLWHVYISPKATNLFDGVKQYCLQTQAFMFCTCFKHLFCAYLK